MSETAAYQPRVRTTRVRTLGDAVPGVRGAYLDDEGPKVVPKTSDELRADREAARDAQPMTTSCGVDGCDFAFQGTAGECRTEAATHRGTAHPERVGARTQRKGIQFKRRGEVIDPAVVAESRRRRQERDDLVRLETINRGRSARGEGPLLEEVASTGDFGAASSSSTHNREGDVKTCNRPGCTGDASDAPARGFLAGKCAAHRAEASAAQSTRLRGRGRGGGEKKTVARVAPGAGEGDGAAREVTPEKAKRSRAVAVREAPPGLRDPIRTADIPYDADLLADEASFLRRRAEALEQMAGAIRVLAEDREQAA